MEKILIEFVKLLIKNVRDKSNRDMDNQLYASNLNSPIAKRWNKEKGTFKYDEMIISDTVDNTIFTFLNSIDNGDLNLFVKSMDGEMINLSEEGLGELGGWYMGEWRTTFSEERVNNDLLD